MQPRIGPFASDDMHTWNDWLGPWSADRVRGADSLGRELLAVLLGSGAGSNVSFTPYVDFRGVTQRASVFR
jgi:hypothetical protein